MSLNIRQTGIIEILRAAGQVGVEELADHFAVTQQTIRRDLCEMADQGVLERVHGGAILRSGSGNIGYDQRRRLNEGAKADIARACAAEIPDNCSIMINLGTTTEAVARALVDHRNLTIITNNMNVANIMVANASAEVIVAGGVLRRSDGGLIGDLTAEFIGQFKPDFAIIGTSAMDAEGDLLDFDLAEVRVSRAIVKRARRSFLVTDISKFGRAAPVRIMSMGQLDTVFVDRPLSAELSAACAAWETRVVVA